ncbi:DUF1304 domain-containing protein [Weissella coleopterorum]|uniref:DUF1304 domain-containing protein n=1 Tax=Weissella coleopterorum TaxID=2714949 RepID=A0A6G8AZP9_9LACO|nr:DUF1304 domain-containing protein [Weissella coleopterorum]QIL50571.1 DUF1304 domain-containing protein [Weissella coleopterorum]
MILFLSTFIALEHFGFMLVEMFAKPEIQSKAFNLPISFLKNDYAQTALKNQGIYNGMLSITILLSNIMVPSAQLKTILFLLMSYVTVVGIYGAFTVTKKIFFIQSLPAIFTILLILIN